MSDFSHVVWSEGMFLRPQHFQQQDRSFHFQLTQSVQQHCAYHWGVYNIKFDTALLAHGKFALSALEASFKGGVIISVPTRDVLPAPISVNEKLSNTLVYLALPSARSNTLNITDDANRLARYRFADHEVIDTGIGSDACETIQIARLGLELKLQSDDLTGYDVLPIARIAHVSEQGQVSLDETYIPPSLNSQFNSVLKKHLSELYGMIAQRAEALAARIGSGQGSASSVADFLMLQLLNRFDAVCAHLLASDGLHPQALFQTMAALAGELATFSSKTKRVPKLPVYDHDNLTKVFAELMGVLNQYLSLVLEQTAVQLPLEQTSYGIRVAQVQNKGLLQRAEFVLAVNADVSSDDIRKRFPAQVKIAPVEHIRDLVNNQLPGITAVGLPVAPRQIPYHAGFHYFKLDKSNGYWARLKDSGGVAIHLSGHYPGLEMQMWAISQ